MSAKTWTCRLGSLVNVSCHFLSVGSWIFSRAQKPCTSSPASHFTNSYDSSGCLVDLEMVCGLPETMVIPGPGFVFDGKNTMSQSKLSATSFLMTLCEAA